MSRREKADDSWYMWFFHLFHPVYLLIFRLYGPCEEDWECLFKNENLAIFIVIIIEFIIAFFNIAHDCIYMNSNHGDDNIDLDSIASAQVVSTLADPEVLEEHERRQKIEEEQKRKHSRERKLRLINGFNTDYKEYKDRRLLLHGAWAGVAIFNTLFSLSFSGDVDNILDPWVFLVHYAVFAVELLSLTHLIEFYAETRHYKSHPYEYADYVQPFVLCFTLLLCFGLRHLKGYKMDSLFLLILLPTILLYGAHFRNRLRRIIRKENIVVPFASIVLNLGCIAYLIVIITRDSEEMCEDEKDDEFHCEDLVKEFQFSSIAISIVALALVICNTGFIFKIRSKTLKSPAEIIEEKEEERRKHVSMI